MDIFVFGTLKSETLRTIVLGRELAPIYICTASIKGFCVYWAKEGPFPVMVPYESSESHGLVLKNLSDVDVERLNYYELGFDDRFRRMWNFYLTSCAATFESGNCDVTQITLQKPESN